jgi:hypothetical protein
VLHVRATDTLRRFDLDGQIELEILGVELDWDCVPKAMVLALQAHVRHQLTDYDEHLLGGMDRREARELVLPEVARILDDWSRT